MERGHFDTPPLSNNANSTFVYTPKEEHHASKTIVYTPKRSVTPALLHSLKKYLLHSLKKYLLNSFKNTRNSSLISPHPLLEAVAVASGKLSLLVGIDEVALQLGVAVTDGQG